MEKVKCPNCDSEYVNKDGQRNGKQRYLCKACRKKFTQGEYIKQEKNKADVEKKKRVQDRFKTVQSKNKIFNFSKLEINEKPIQEVININNVELNSKILKIIDKDLRNNYISLEKYKHIIKKISSEEENEIAKRLANIEIKEIELLMNKSLFKNHNEKLDALIIKIIIAAGEEGIKMLMEYINNSREYKMTKYNFNVIGKHLSQNLSISWNIIMQYIKEGISKNCAYTITRYLNYVVKINYRELRNTLCFEKIRELYFHRKWLSIYGVFNLPKISDSDYIDNFSEYTYSLEKILDKMSKKELIDYNYLEQYNNSIFTEEVYMKICLEGNHLSEKGNKLIGNQIKLFYKEYSNLEYRGIQKEYEVLLDRYSNFIYTTVLKYGIEEFKTFFKHDWGESYIHKCKILSKETEILAEKICEEYFKNPRKDYPKILDYVFHNLLYALNEKAIDTLIYMIDNEIITEADYLFYQNTSFSFVLGVTEKFYGDFYNIKKDFSFRRSHKGLEWERIVGYILNEKYEDICHHPILDNNKIPDYALIEGEKLEKIIECKLILGFEEFKETITKYHSYCNLIEFYCLRNDIDEKIINSKEYKEIIRKTSRNFRYEIKDFNDVYNITNKYKEALVYFEKNVKSVTQKNLLKEKICLNFKDIKKDKILYLLDYTFSKSELF